MIKNIILVLVFSLWLINPCFPESITLNTTDWTQEQKNMIQAMAVKILYDEEITYSNIYSKDGKLEIEQPSKDIALVLTSKAILDEYARWKVINEAATLENESEYNAKINETERNLLLDIKLNDIDGQIDSISNIDEIKMYLKTLT